MDWWVKRLNLEVGLSCLCLFLTVLPLKETKEKKGFNFCGSFQRKHEGLEFFSLVQNLYLEPFT